MARLLTVALASVLGTCSVGAATGQEAPPPPPTDEPIVIETEESSSLRLYGDLRLRWESDWDSRTPSGAMRADRDRFRIRARVGLEFAFNDALVADVRARTGDHDSQQSPHITLWQDDGDEGEQDDVTIDRAYLKWSIDDRSSLTAGRTGLQTWRPNEFFWDDDVYVDGLAFATAFGADAQWKLNLSAALLPDGDASHSFDERSLMLAGQVTRSFDVGDDRLQLAQTLLFIDDEGGTVNAVNDDENFLFSYTNAQYTFDPDGAIPVKVGADLMFNLHEGPAGTDPDDRFGFDLYVTAGRYKQPGDWTLGYAFARIERWSVPRFLAQDDWVRWGSATQTRSSDFYGHELRAGYVLADRVKLLGRFYAVDAISSVEDGMRFRFDVNISF